MCDLVVMIVCLCPLKVLIFDPLSLVGFLTRFTRMQMQHWQLAELHALHALHALHTPTIRLLWPSVQMSLALLSLHPVCIYLKCTLRAPGFASAPLAPIFRPARNPGVQSRLRAAFSLADTLWSRTTQAAYRRPLAV